MNDNQSLESNRKRPPEESNNNTISNKLRLAERDFILNADGTVLHDHKGAPVSVDKFLGTKPLQSVISTRAGPGGKKLAYMAGEVVTQTLNDAFGYDGWSMEVKDKTREESVKDDKGRYHVAYTATVRITLTRTGAYREDCGAGDAIDRSLGTASGHAIKGAITDAMKRAARHFGEKTGNALYHSGFKMSCAPATLKDAFEQFDIQRAQDRFGFQMDKTGMHQKTASHQAFTNQNSNNGAAVKQEVKIVSSNEAFYNSSIPKPITSSAYSTQQATQAMTTKPTSVAKSTCIAINKIPYNSNCNPSVQSNTKSTAELHVTPYQGANANSTNGNCLNTGFNYDVSKFNTTQTAKMNASNTRSSTSQSFVTNGKENLNPQQHNIVPKGELDRLHRLGTSRDQQHSNSADGMLGLASSILAMNGQTHFNTGAGSDVKTAKAGVKNPYSQF